MNREKSLQIAHVLIDLGKILVLFVPLVYTAGWSYAYHYFGKFHLGLLGLDIPREYYFLYGFWTIQDQLILLFILMIIAVVVILPASLCSRQKTHTTGDPDSEGYRTGPDRVKRCLHAATVSVLLPALVFSLFWAFYYFGESAAQSAYEEQAENDFPSYPRVRVWIKTDAGQAPAAMAGEWEKGGYRLLMRNKDNLYLFYPAQPGDKIPTDIIPTGQVQCFRILPHYWSDN